MVAEIKAEHKQIVKRLDKGDNHFAMIEKMLRDIEQKLSKEIDEIKSQIAELKPIADILRKPWFVGLLISITLLAGVAIGFAAIIGLDLAEPLSKIKAVTSE